MGGSDLPSRNAGLAGGDDVSPRLVLLGSGETTIQSRFVAEGTAEPDPWAKV